MADQTSQVTGRPYSEKKEEGYIIREFSQDTRYSLLRYAGIAEDP